MSTYLYPFNKSNNLMLLQNYLKAYGIPEIEGLSNTPDTMTVHTFIPLDNAMRILLDRLIDEYDESKIELEGQCHNILTLPKQTSNTEWTSLFSWSFPGRNSIEYIKMNIDSFLKTDDMDATYSLRAYDVMNNKVLFSVTYSNCDEKCQSMHTIMIDNNLLPYQLTTLELHGKVCSCCEGGKATVHVKHVCVVTPES